MKFNKRRELEKLVILGDVHGKWDKLKEVCKRWSDKTVLCVGDVGIGFPGPQPLLPQNFRFIRGNHDNPGAVVKHGAFIGDHGVWRGSLFCFGGAASVDAHLRTPGIDWWSNEEQGPMTCDDALKAYEQAQPGVLISHDAPTSLSPLLVAAACRENPRLAALGAPRPTRTSTWLQQAIERSPPALHIHGHWHVSLTYRHAGTVFVSLAELEALPLAQCLRTHAAYWNATNPKFTEALRA